ALLAPDVGIHEPGPLHIAVRAGGAVDIVVSHRERLIIILLVHNDGGPDLLGIAEAGGLAGLLARLGKDGEADRGQDGNDRDQDEQLDQGETGSTAHRSRWTSSGHEVAPFTSTLLTASLVTLFVTEKPWGPPSTDHRESLTRDLRAA